MGVKQNDFIRLVNKRIYYNNRNLIAGFFGATGSGKSWSALRLARMIKPEFSVDDIYFDTEKLLNNIMNLEKGDVVLYDEAEAFDPQRWRDEEQQLFYKVIKKFRNRNNILLFTVPAETDVREKIQDKVHLICELISRKPVPVERVKKYNQGFSVDDMPDVAVTSDREGVLCNVVDPSMRRKKTRMSKPIFPHPKSPVDYGKLGRMDFLPPKKGIAREYKKVRKEWSDKGLNKDIEAYSKGEALNNKIRKKYEKIKKEILKDIDKYSRDYKSKPGRKLIKGMIQGEFGLSNNDSTAIYGMLKNDDEVMDAVNDYGERNKNNSDSKQEKKTTKKEKIKKMIKKNPDKNYREISEMVGAEYGYVREVAARMDST